MGTTGGCRLEKLSLVPSTIDSYLLVISLFSNFHFKSLYYKSISLSAVICLTIGRLFLKGNITSGSSIQCTLVNFAMPFEITASSSTPFVVPLSLQWIGKFFKSQTHLIYFNLKLQLLHLVCVDIFFFWYFCYF